ncbi:MAG: zinc ribbon domain-containing protein [Treponema sp.]|jgi:uncharacterized paraquat-inducible protein A|nr:zinc ribbon domain-containing protein [Treponema sp.]
MAEDQKMKASQAQCWQCGEVVYKGTKTCPKCGAPSPTADIPKLRKVTPILFRAGMPVGIVLIIAGFIMLGKGAGGMMEDIMQGNIPFFLYGGLEIACLLIVIGIIGVIIGPVFRSFLAKVDRATREGQ